MSDGKRGSDDVLMSDDVPMSDGDLALIELGRLLSAAQYRFITITPLTHARVNARLANAEARDLRGVFGWNRPFRRSLLSKPLLDTALRAGVIVEREDGLLHSAVRVSSLGAQLYVHSAFPTDSADAVFFGPDTYRFVSALEQRARPARRAVDLGCGSGAGGLSLAARVGHLLLTDVNPAALRLARVNAALGAHEHVAFAQGDLYDVVKGDVDLILANPPYLADDAGRIYRDGGGTLGTGLSRRIVKEGLPRLRDGGQLILYSATPVRDGQDTLWNELAPLFDAHDFARDFTLRYQELDPDVFGEELDHAHYGDVERIAVVCLEINSRR